MCSKFFGRALPNENSTFNNDKYVIGRSGYPFQVLAALRFGAAGCCGLSTSIPHAIKTKSINLMESEKIETALLSALSLLNNEVDNIEFDKLKNEYLLVIEQLETALNEIAKDE